MVRKTISVVVLMLLSSGCGLARLFKQTPPAPERIVQNSSGSDCADWSTILNGSDSESAAALDCWSTQSEKLWTEIQPEEKDAISDGELSTLILRGVVPFDDREDALKKLLVAKDLMGFGPKITREKLDRWIAWARANRAEIRDLYQRMILKPNGERFAYDDTIAAGRLLASALTEMGWTKSLTELSNTIHLLLDPQGPLFRDAATPSLRVAMNALGMICPDITNEEVVNTAEVSSCLEKVPAYFSKSGPWIESLINPSTDLTADQIEAIERSLRESEPLIGHWFKQRKLKPLRTQLWIDLAKALRASPPANLTSSLRLIRKLKTRSNENFIYPETLIEAFRRYETYQHLLDGALPTLLLKAQTHTCVNSDAASWEECILPGSSDDSNDSDPALVALAFRVRDTHYAGAELPIDGRELSRVAFYDTLSDLILEVFGDGNSKQIQVSLVEKDDGATELLTTGVRTYQAVENYLANLGHRLNREKVEPEGTIDIAAHWDIKGFAKLIAMTSDVLVSRPMINRSLPENFISKITALEPESTMTLDQDAITASLVTLDGLSRIRASYLAELGFGPDPRGPISRDAVLRDLPRILARVFPRTARSCEAEGFDKTCGAVYAAILPETTPGSGLIDPSDLDILTILSLGVESTFDSCDENGDGKLSMGLLQNNSELQCGFVRIKDIISRLLDSGILNTSASQKSTIQSVLKLLDSTFITRAFGEGAIVDGSLGGLFPIAVLFHGIIGGDATIGSTYALVAEIATGRRTQ